MVKFVNALTSLLISTCFIGCTGKESFNTTPLLKQEFKRPKSVLQEKYPDIISYSGFNTYAQNRVQLNYLTQQW
jgi:hypothetical protein